MKKYGEVMTKWPVPESFDKRVPSKGSPGSFWEDRYNQYNCGVDIYAPEGAEVLAVDNGTVIKKGVFSHPEYGRYFHETYYVIIKTKTKLFMKYAALSEIDVAIGEKVQKGQKIGTVGKVFNTGSHFHETPSFIQDMISNDRMSMLHLEFLKAPIIDLRPYFFGNFLGNERPHSLVDPAVLLNNNIN